MTSEMVNSSYLVEIKIGQGAKPGEGGHLPGKKVTAKVAQARNATEGTDLISPSNNHDLYSIEDLAELIDELKTANPDVRVSVKVPVVPNIGTIGVGIAKAGADMITLSGFEGGTGAARSHALRHVGLPSDIGTRAVHLALMEAGIRNRVEIWADGGYRHAWDIIKLHCLGANRVGLRHAARWCRSAARSAAAASSTPATWASPRRSRTRRRPTSRASRSSPRRNTSSPPSNSARFFQSMGEEVREITAMLGYERTQDLVGRSDLLVQARAKDRVDVNELIKPLEEMLDLEPIDLPAQIDEREAAGLICARPIRMKAKGSSAAVATVFAEMAPGKVARRGLGRAGRRRRPRAGHRAGRGDRPQSHLRRRRAGHRRHARLAALQRRLDRRPGLRGVQRLRPRHHVEGGAQDGVAKTMLGGKVAVLQGQGRLGKRVNGSVGKSFAYGAAARAAVRAGRRRLALLHPALRRRRGDRGRARQPLDDSLGSLADRANIKGFAFEYMTNGRAVVMGDPGPWMCAGQTGGRVYLRVNDEWNLDREALERRKGKGAKIEIRDLDAEGVLDIQELLGHYCDELTGHRPGGRGIANRRAGARRAGELRDVDPGGPADGSVDLDGVGRAGRQRRERALPRRAGHGRPAARTAEPDEVQHEAPEPPTASPSSSSRGRPARRSEHAVEAAVVEHLRAVVVAVDQRVSADTVGSSSRTWAERLRPTRVQPSWEGTYL